MHSPSHSPKPPFEAWREQAERAGTHFWAYAELVDDNPDGARAAWEAGEDPFEYIKEEGLDLDLEKFGPAWGSW